MKLTGIGFNLTPHSSSVICFKRQLNRCLIDESVTMFILSILLDIIGYKIARILLPIFSIGLVSVERMSSTDAGYNWAGYKISGGKIIFSSSMAGWIGIFFLSMLFVLVLVVIE